MTVTEGLSDNEIKAIYQDSRGFLWIGTSDGLNRYDGRVVRQYPRPGNDLTDLNINCIAEDADGNIWIGTENGLNKLDPFTEKITRYFGGIGPTTIPYKWCNSLYLDKQKKLWLSTEKGVALYDKASDSFINYPINVFGKDSRINKYIVSMLEDRLGRFWLATSYGIKLFDRQTKAYRSFHFDEPKGQSIRENTITTINEDPQGRIWAGTYSGGIFQYNDAAGRFDKIEVPGYQMGAYVVSDILFLNIMNKDHLLLATGDSIICAEYIQGMDGQNARLVPGKTSLLGGFGNIDLFFTDRNKNLWWGGTKGLLKMNADRFAYRWVSMNSGTQKGPFFYHIIPGIKTHTFYLSAAEGWWEYNTLTDLITPHQLPANENGRLKTINNWINDQNGYWFTAVQGFGYYDIKRNKLTDLTHIPEGMTGQRTTGFIAKDRYGKLWVSLRRSGILVYDPATGKAEQLFADSSQAENVYGRSITDLQASPDGKIWFCSGKLYCVDPEDRSVKTYENPGYAEPVDTSKISPFRIQFDLNGRLLIFARRRIYELKQEKLVPVYPAKGLSDFIIEKVVLAKQGQLYITTRKTVLRTDPTFRMWTDLGSIADFDRDKLPFEVNHSLPHEIFLTGTGGIGIIDENDTVRAKTVNPAIISRVKYGDKESFLVSECDLSVTTSYKNAIEIEVSPLNFLPAREQKIWYQLEGWDEDWKQLSGNSPLRYEQLPPGRYKFKVKAGIEDTESSDASFAFRITPPFYKTWWFISLLILTTCSAIYLIYRYRLNSALKMERLRTRIATDLHDDIGATLSSISMYSETVKNQVKQSLPHLEPVLNKMGQNSRDMVSSMSDIVWAIKPGNDGVEKLVRRMEDHARDLCALKNVHLDFEADPILKEIKLSLEQRKNIYLIFKEALNNALKYSDATKITIQVTRSGRKIRMIVKDNGKGFEQDSQRRGNGLNNMKQRADELNASYRLDTQKEKGTEVILECPL